MNVFLSLIPFLLFVSIFLGSGIVFSIIGIENAFYQVSPILAIIPSVFLALLISKSTGKDKIKMLIDTIRKKENSGGQFPAKESILCNWCYYWEECPVKNGSNPYVG